MGLKITRKKNRAAPDSDGPPHISEAREEKIGQIGGKKTGRGISSAK